jgi:hypothetical protein
MNDRFLELCGTISPSAQIMHDRWSCVAANGDYDRST